MNTTAWLVRTGHGTAPAHHGELLQGVFDDAGRATPGLVTLPLRQTGASATFVPRAGDGRTPVAVHPPEKEHARSAVEQLLRHLHAGHGLEPLTGRLTIRGRLPVGLGMGSSSADVLAAMRAVSDAVGLAPATAALCRLAAASEGACDPLAHLPRTVLFAQREGRVLEDLGGPLPPLVVLSCDTGSGRPVDTTSCALAPAAQVGEYERLRVRLRHAVRRSDAEAVGAVASASAELNQARLPRPELAVLRAACRRHGGVGVQVAHSGSVAGVLLAGRARSLHERLRRCAADLESRGVHVRGWYDVPDGT